MIDLKEELKKRAEERPDKWTLAWWDEQFEEVRKAYRGATHAINLSIARCEDVCRGIDEVQERIRVAEQEREADRAKLGALTARVERMAEFLNELKAQLKEQQTT